MVNIQNRELKRRLNYEIENTIEKICKDMNIRYDDEILFIICIHMIQHFLDILGSYDDMF